MISNMISNNKYIIESEYLPKRIPRSSNIMIISKSRCAECDPFSEKIKQCNNVSDQQVGEQSSVLCTQFKKIILGKRSDDDIDSVIKTLHKNGKNAKDFMVMSLKCQLLRDPSQNNIAIEIYEMPDHVRNIIDVLNCISLDFIEQTRKLATKRFDITIGCKHCSKSSYVMLKDKLDNMLALLDGDYISDKSAPFIYMAGHGL